MTNILEDLDRQQRARAKEKLANGQVFIDYRYDRSGNLRPYVRDNYGVVTSRAGNSYGLWAGPFKNLGEAQLYIDNASFERSYAAGHSSLWVGHRVVWTGKPYSFHTNTREITTNEIGMIVYDHGHDFRFWIRMEQDGLLIRPGGTRQWERIFDDLPEPLIGYTATFMHERNIPVTGVVVKEGVGPHAASYLTVYVNANEMRKQELVREKRHDSFGMTRQVLRKRIISVREPGVMVPINGDQHE